MLPSLFIDNLSIKSAADRKVSHTMALISEVCNADQRVRKQVNLKKRGLKVIFGWMNKEKRLKTETVCIDSKQSKHLLHESKANTF